MHRFESPVRLSQSLLWSLQARAYGRGQEAWSSGTVPSYVSTNAFLAQRYAEVIEGFARDQKAGGRPITIIELGAGSGRLGYFVLRSLNKLWSSAAGALPPFRYVLTDFAGRTIDAWRTSGAFDEFIRAGQADFAHFDADLPGPLCLEASGEQIAADTPAGPTVVIANYVISSLRQDMFRVDQGNLFETRVAISTEAPAELSAPGIMGKLSLAREHVSVDADYYGDAALDGLLARYAQRLAASVFLIPLAFLKACRFLSRCADGPLFALVGDRGPKSLTEMEGAGVPALQVRGDYAALPANLDAIAAFAAAAGGGTLLADDIDGLFTVGGYSFGAGPVALPETTRAFQRSLGAGEARDLYGLFSQLGRSGLRVSPGAALHALRLSNHDPRTFVQLAPSLEQVRPDAPADLRAALARALRQVRENHYPLGLVSDIFYRLGRVYQRLDEPAMALDCFERSGSAASAGYMRLYRIAQCQAAMGRLEEARTRIADCLSEKPDFDRARAFQSRLART